MMATAPVGTPSSASVSLARTSSATVPPSTTGALSASATGASLTVMLTAAVLDGAPFESSTV